MYIYKPDVNYSLCGVLQAFLALFPTEHYFGAFKKKLYIGIIFAWMVLDFILDF